MERTAEIEAATVGRKRKVSIGESEFSTSSIQLKNPRLAPENSASVSQSSGNLSCETVGPDNASASCCSSNGSSEVTKETSKFVDLEDNEVTVEFFATSAGGDSFDYRERRGTTPLREVEAESGELESTARPQMAEKMPSEAELDEFFSAAEKNLQKKFIDQ
ncbi:hypothetical protein ACS0TY_006205 [Phlomoides rotata]